MSASDEATQIFSNLAQDLAFHGLGINDIVKMRMLFKGRSDFAGMNAIRVPLFAQKFPELDFPATSGFVTGDNANIPYNFAIEIIAHADKQVVNANDVVLGWSGQRSPFSHAIIANGILFASGQGGWTAAGEMAADDAMGQAKAALDVLRKVLAAASAEPLDVLSLNVYLSPLSYPSREAIAAEVAAFLGNEGATTHSLVTILPVYQLFRPDMQVAMEFCAQVPEHNDTVKMAPKKSSTAGSSHAVRRGNFVLARSSGTAGDPGAATRSALVDLAAILSGVDANIEALKSTTIWCPPEEDCSAVEDIVRETIGPKIAITLATLAPGNGCRVVLEFVGVLLRPET